MASGPRALKQAGTKELEQAPAAVQLASAAVEAPAEAAVEAWAEAWAGIQAGAAAQAAAEAKVRRFPEVGA